MVNTYQKIIRNIRVHASEPYNLSNGRIGLSTIFIITLLFFISYSPFIYFQFGVHNDFEIWAYNNKSCCMDWPESGMLVLIGRFVQAILQNVYLSFFSDLQSLTFGRIFGILFISVGALILTSLGRKNGMDKISSMALGFTAFLLPSPILSLSWPTNFVPGIFNVILALAIASIFPTWKSVFYKGNSKFWILLVACFIFLLASLFIYSPTSGFFLIPAMIAILYSANKRYDVRAQAIFSFVFFSFACLIYFILHRVIYMNLMHLVQQGNSLYRFDLTNAILKNLWKFTSEILPPMLNLWNPAPTFGIAVLYISFLLIPAAFYFFRQNSSSSKNGLASHNLFDVALFLILFFSSISSGLLAIGRPPQYYRVWFAGAAGIMLLLFWSLEYKPWVGLKKIIICLLVLIACLLSFNTSYFMAITLSRQFKYALDFIPAQYSAKRDQYIIVENRPKSMLFGVPRWGEFSFLYTLSPGHVRYILKKYLNVDARPHTETFVVDQKVNQILLEPELLDETSWVLKPDRSDPKFKKIASLFDSHEEWFYEENGSGKTEISFESDKATHVGCYKIFAGSKESAERMPMTWNLSGSNDSTKWDKLDSRSNQTKWTMGENRSFITNQIGKYKYFRLNIASSNNSKSVRIPEIRIFTNKKACEIGQNAPVHFVNTNIIRSPSQENGVKIELGGVVTESGLSDPSFRILKALDNITYTFWEASAFLPLNVDIQFLDKKNIKCYSFLAGNDLAGERMPRSWRLLASNDFNEWALLDERNNETNWVDNTRRLYEPATNGDYLFYRIEFLAINGGGVLRIYEMDMSEDESCTNTIP